MSVPNGSQPQHKPTQKPESLNSNASDARMTWLALPPVVRLLCVVLLLLLAGSLVACGTTSAPSSFTPSNPEPPPSVLPESSPEYLSNASANISTWRRLLNELITKPAP
jgi:hypothetical protein